MENKKIPVAKDNTEMSDMVRNYRLKAGHFADQAFDGLQAIDPVKTVKPDLILLDKSLDCLYYLFRNHWQTHSNLFLLPMLHTRLTILWHNLYYDNLPLRKFLLNIQQDLNLYLPHNHILVGIVQNR